MRHHGGMFRSHRPDVQIVHFHDTLNAHERVAHVLIIHPFGNGVRQHARRVLKDAPGRMQHEETNDKGENRVSQCKSVAPEINQSARRDCRHRPQKVTQHMHEGRARINVFLIARQRPGHRNIDQQTDHGNDHDRTPGNGRRILDAVKGLHKNPDDHGKHRDAVHKGRKHLNAPVTETVVVVHALAGNDVCNEGKQEAYGIGDHVPCVTHEGQ
ncbi:arsenical-resistance protein [Sutterella sp. CAG:397]|nr:arsenical-resistance protein [Sutterella sp. CAG:397]